MKRLPLKILCAVLAVVLTQAALAEQAAPGSLQGVVVVNGGSNDALPNVTVELRAGSAAASSSAVTTSTDSGGRFLFPNVAPGSYRVIATRPGYVTTEYGQPRPGAPGLELA